MKQENSIHPDLIPYFTEIANRLWSGHAAVMVGAGFSRNARRNSSTSKGFPDWNQLGDIFFEKVNGRINENKDCGENKYRNVLRLADEVQAAFGRSILDNIIKNEIPDKEYQPSIIHEKLLQFPWVDVFTTNYDTLLERASERVLQRRYDTVVNKEDLVYSAKPRIIKLHGSFPSERPFVITEEDYRKYPTEYAPFVNTVQQALLENTLCLLGFSGTDPNFLHWIGWIRDNLGKENSPKIYLIGILNLSSAQKELLKQQNIIPLDLSICPGTDGNHENALNQFFDFLLLEGKIDNRLEWPQNNIHFHYLPGEDNLSKVSAILENWTLIRKEFPNWLIVPEDRRDILTSYTNDSFIFHLEEIDSPMDIHFLYEYNWRLEKCLVPIYNNLIPHYERTINNYNPFPDHISIENAIIPKESKLNWDQITRMWIELQLAIMRNFREEAFHKQWQHYNSRLSLLIAKFEPEILARYYYERCLYALFSLDIPGVRKEIESWSRNTSLPYWEAKRAGLLAEIGDITEAEKILEESLTEVRSRLNLSPITNDYSLVSQEAYIMVNYRNVKFASNILSGEFSLPQDEAKIFKERWSKLVQYKCDPWMELKLFEIRLEKDVSSFKSVREKIGFGIGEKTTSHHWGINEDVHTAYAYLRFVEEIGFPLHLPNISAMDASKEVIKHVANNSPFWTFITFLRIGEKDLTDYLFNRKSFSEINFETIDNKIEEYLKVLERSTDELKKADTFRNKALANNLSELIPEVLSRLCVKSSFSTKLKLLDWLKDIYYCDYKDRFRGINNLGNRLLNSFSKSEQYTIIPKLLEFPILPELHHLINNEYSDPFIFIDPQKGKEKIYISESIIRDLMDFGKKEGKERSTSIRRLVVLYNLKLLSDEQISLLGDTIWYRVDEKNGFPTGLDYYNFSYIQLPHPSTIYPEEILKKYIDAIEIPIQSNKKEQGLAITGGNIQAFEEILGTGRSSVLFIWTKKSLNTLVEKVVTWWEADKHYLNEKDKSHPFGSKHEEFRARFRNLVNLYSNIFGPNYRLLNPANQNEILRILQEFEGYGLADNEAYAAFHNHFPLFHEKTCSKIHEGLLSKSREKIIDALKGIIKLIELKTGEINNLILLVSEQIRNRCDTELDSILKVMTLVVKSHSALLSKNILLNIEFGLERLIMETKICPDDTIEVVSKKISIKVEIAKVTVALNSYFIGNCQEIPEYINQWKVLCLDENEFSEIRRIWLDVVE